MIRYLIIMLSCQLLFLLVYDLFLKKETFFNWNRVYLLLTPVLSLLIPFIKLEALTTTAPEPLAKAMPVVFLEAADPVRVAAAPEASGFELPLWGWIALVGSIVALVFFIYKLSMLLRLRRSGIVRRFRDYLQVEIPASEVAFSFFRQIFLGGKVLERKHDHIVEHELVHIREGHSWDLLYFELLRVAFWFNPLVYVFQARITELHEYVADAKMVSVHKKETYQYLLEEVFQTQKISFINSFFNHSLIKKRIVMIHQNRSKAIKKFKYMLMVPLILGMLVYTSCEQELINDNGVSEQIQNAELKRYYLEYRNSELSEQELVDKANNILDNKYLEEENYYRLVAIRILEQEMYNEAMGLTDPNGEIPSVLLNAEWSAGKNKELEALLNPENKDVELNMVITVAETEKKDVPYTTIPVKPSFKTPCEDGQEAFECFKEKLNSHVLNTFRYPEEAKAQHIQGRVYINFRINTDGSVTILKTRAPHDLLDQEARRIIEALPDLNPGGNEDGDPVPVTFAYPIIFKLSSGADEVAETKDIDQYRSDEGDVPFTVIPVKPSFKTPCEDGQSAFACFKQKLDAHVMNTFRYPEEARAGNIQGKAYINFRINTDGSVTVLNTRAPHESLDKEARRIIQALPELNPGGDEDGNAVPVTFAYPIVFALN